MYIFVSYDDPVLSSFFVLDVQVGATCFSVLVHSETKRKCFSRNIRRQLGAC